MEHQAGFYSSNLLSYLVEGLNIPLKYIKYMIITKRALKPNTLSKFIEYLFDNFPEKQGKKLANSFVGELGTKYSKLNQGFTRTEYDTAMCWTKAMADKRKVTTDHFQDMSGEGADMCQRLFHDNTSINRFVVLEAILNCLLPIE